MQKNVLVSRGNTPGTPSKGGKKAMASIASSGTSTPARKNNTTDQQQLDMAGLNLSDTLTGKKQIVEEPPKVSMAREKVLEEAKRALEADEGKKGISIVVIGDLFFLVLYSMIWLIRVLFDRPRRCWKVDVDGSTVI
jgi:elongation factor 1 alpha-like protein